MELELEYIGLDALGTTIPRLYIAKGNQSDGSTPLRFACLDFFEMRKS